MRAHPLVPAVITALGSLVSVSSSQAALFRPAAPSEVAAIASRAATVQALVVESAKDPAGVAFEVTLGGRQVRIRAEQVDLRAPDFALLLTDGAAQEEATVPAVVTCQGSVDGELEAIVAVTVSGADVDATIQLDDRTLWGIAPVARGSGGPEHLVFCGDDALLRGHACGTTEQAAPVAMPVTTGTPYLHQAEIACEVDFAFYLREGRSITAVNAYVSQVMNWSDAVFRRDAGITFRMTALLIQTGSLYSSTNSSELLRQFRAYWSANRGAVRRDLAHLFTGQELDGNTIGVAYVGVVCDSSWAFGLSQRWPHPLQRCALTAHELGHNWNADHCSGSDCRVMCPSIGGCSYDMTGFGASARTAVGSFRDTRTCLSGVGGYFTMKRWTPTGIGSIHDFWVGDFDGDGKDDVFRYVAGSGLEVMLSRGSWFGSRATWTSAGVGSVPSFWVGDFNGDGKDDVFRYLTGSGLEVMLSRGDRFGSRAVWTPAGIGSIADFWVGDFNGDGKDDVFRYVTGSGLEVMLSRGDRFGSRSVWTGSGVGSIADFWVGDFDGDGKDDVSRYRAGTGIEVMRSLGNAFASPVVWAGSVVGDLADFWVGDFNGDGLDDVFRYVAGVGVQVMLSRGDRFGTVSTWSGAGVGALTWWTGDFDGDGRCDIMRYRDGVAVDVGLCSRPEEVAVGVVRHGTGCSFPSHRVPRMTVAGTPKSGTTLTVRVTELGSRASVLLLGASDSAWMGLRLPLSLGALGSPACRLYVSPDHVLGPFAASGGYPLRIPGDVSLVARCFLAQALIPPDSASSASWLATEYLAVEVLP